MNENHYLWIASLFVLTLISVEYFVSVAKGKKIYRIQNTTLNITIGMFDRAIGLFLYPATYFLYDYIFDNYAFFQFENTALVIVIGIILSDFLWYLYHVLGHKVNIFWGAHIVHHQSEDYNYSIALTITPLQAIVRFLIWTGMVFAGFSPQLVLGSQLLIGVYQFFLHSTLIPKLGFIEKILITPSHHRVHHGSNENYLDKNYGGVLLIWDKMFGTFEEEKEEVVFGITKDLNTRGFMKSIFHYYCNLAFQMKQLPDFKDKMRLLFKGPDWVPASGELEISSIYIEKGDYHYHDISIFNRIYLYISMAFIFAILIFTGLYLKDLTAFNLSLLISAIIISIIAVNRIIENKKIILLEILKYGVLAFVCIDLIQ